MKEEKGNKTGLTSSIWPEYLKMLSKGRLILTLFSYGKCGIWIKQISDSQKCAGGLAPIHIASPQEYFFCYEIHSL